MVEVFRFVVTGAFVLLAIMGLRLWRRHRTAPSCWLIAMFVSLGTVRLAGQLLPEGRTGLTAVIGLAVTAVLVAFPYFLFRFAESLDPVPAVWRALVGTVMAVLVLATLGVYRPSTVEGSQPAGTGILIFGVIVVWTALTVWVVWRLWRAGRSQPTLARRRMWTMATAAGLLNAALLLGGLADALDTVGEAVAIVSAGAFVLAFYPPRFVRALWRQADERTLWEVEVDLVAAADQTAVVAAVLPHAARLLGADGALFIDQDGRETSAGLDMSRRRHIRERLLPRVGEVVIDLDAGLAVLGLQRGRLAVAASAYTPLFGQDELQLLQRLGALMDLALSRAEASMTTATLAAFESALVPRAERIAGLTTEVRYRAGLKRLRLGGDFMDVVALPDGAASFVIGDVNGHGPRDAAFAVSIHAGWKAVARTDPLHPSAWLTLLDDTFFHEHAERLVTVLTGRIDVRHRTITLASAGHCPPIVVGPGSHVLDFDPDPLLGIGHDGQRREVVVHLDDGQGLLLYTDGLIEQPKPESPEERWSDDDLHDWLARRPVLDNLDLDALLWDFGRGDFADDVAIMLLRPEDQGRGARGGRPFGPAAAQVSDDTPAGSPRRDPP